MLDGTVIWLAYLVIAGILAVVILRSRLDSLKRWMLVAFFWLVTTCELARLLVAGLFTVPPWMLHDLRIIAVFTALSIAIAITWVTVTHKIIHPEVADYFTNVTQFDAVTEMPTLRVMQRLIARDIRKWPERRFALLVLDLDQFQRVSHSLGYHARDDLIAQVSRRLRHGLRRSDRIARIGVDEFALYLRRARDVPAAQQVAEHLQRSLAGIINLEGYELAVTASVGVSLYPESGETPAALLRNAETAMDMAKRRGSGRVEFFNHEMTLVAEKKISLENALRHAIERAELSLHYQPQVSLAVGAVTGLEALLRWNSKEFGSVSPAEFLPLAEETGLMAPITNWVIAEACRYLTSLNAGRKTPLIMAVNLSPSQLQREDIAAIVERELIASGLPGNLLEIEITENALMDDFPKTLNTLDHLRALGVRVAIDDFGTGFSSMSYILKFNIDRLKIDQSFIRDSTVNKQSAVVTSSIISLAHGLGIDVIAEGVETQDQVELLARAGCQELQGYLFSRPVPAEHLPSTLESLALRRSETSSSGAAPFFTPSPLPHPA